MTTLSASLTNSTVLLPQSRDSSPHVSGQVSTSAHPLAAATQGRQHRSSSIPGVTWRHPACILATDVSWAGKGPQECWHLHRSECRSRL